ncbi:MAG: CocE/NonD family hydrolase [Xenophilus sp.]
MHTTEERDGMRIEWDAPIPMDDGLVLRADIFRPLGEGRWPVIMSHGPYGKGVAFQEAYRTAWENLLVEHPEAVKGTSSRYANWETVDPEKWVPDGYVVIRVDSRGAGRSPGYLCHNDARENRDYHLCIEWAAAQPWCNGKVGLNGISYYAANQWRAAATQPPHLAAICVWEGWQDNYREANRHGGILSSWRRTWQQSQVKTVQHGVGPAGRRHPVTGVPACGDETLSDAQLAANREDMWAELLAHPLDGPYWRERSADLSRVTVPLLSAGNWAGHGLHGRGNFEGWLGAASTQKWLEVHAGSHWGPFYADWGVALQKRFFGHFLKGEDTGWQHQPPVDLEIRHVDRFVRRAEQEWPLARTQWTHWYLHPQDLSLSTTPPEAGAVLEYDPKGEGITFQSASLVAETEITGPSVLRLFVSSGTPDADLFVVLRVFAPDGREVVFRGAVDFHCPVAQGWLRASQRKTDPARSLPYRPWRPHDEHQPLAPGEVVPMDVEIWPTCVVVPAGYRIAVTVRSKDYSYEGLGATPGVPLTGVGKLRHESVTDKPDALFGGPVRLHFGPGQRASVLLPVIGAAEG